MRHCLLSSALFLSLLLGESDAFAPSGIRGVTAQKHGALRLQCNQKSETGAARPTAAPVHLGLRAEGTIGRRSALTGVLIGFLGFTQIPLSSNAAVPTMDEYNVGSGTVVRPQVKGQKKEKYQAPKDKESAAQLVKDADTLLDNFYALIPKLAWDNIRNELQTVPVTAKYVKPDKPGVLMSQFFGLDSLKAMGQTLQVDDKKAAAMEKARKEASLAILELSDFVFTNRVVFFNEEDKKSVAQLADSNLDVDINEAKEIVDRAKAQVAKLTTLLSS